MQEVSLLFCEKSGIMEIEKETCMKKIFLRVIFSLLMCVAFLSCKTEEEEESESYRVDLPSSVGADELSGTKWEIFRQEKSDFQDLAL